MYEVPIRKMYRHADGPTVLWEYGSQINHERRAENLAAKIARQPRVDWVVEIEEITGRFEDHARLASDVAFSNHSKSDGIPEMYHGKQMQRGSE